MTDLAIETRGLTRHFGHVCAVNDLSLRVARGSVYAFLGPNGAGKTTTIRMVLGLAHLDRGEIRAFGQSLNRANRRAFLRRIGSMVEAPCFYPHLTGQENLRTTQGLIALDRSSVERVLRIVRLERDAHRLVQTYSQGMRQPGFGSCRRRRGWRAPDRGRKCFQVFAGVFRSRRGDSFASIRFKCRGRYGSTGKRVYRSLKPPDAHGRVEGSRRWKDSESARAL